MLKCSSILKKHNMHLYQEYVGDLNLVPISTLNHCVMLSTPLSLSVPVFLIYKADLMHFSFYYFLIYFLYFSSSGDGLSFPYYVESVVLYDNFLIMVFFSIKLKYRLWTRGLATETNKQKQNKETNKQTKKPSFLQNLDAFRLLKKPLTPTPVCTLDKVNVTIPILS